MKSRTSPTRADSREPSSGETSVEGLVVRTESGYHRILSEGGIVVARAPKRLLRGERSATTAVVIGDRVRARLLPDGTGLVTEILPRANELVRGAAGGGRYLDVIAANLDLLVAVHSFKDPDFNSARLDRYLVMAEAAEIPALVCLNKLDLIDSVQAETLAEPYRQAGYRVILTCARTAQRVDELREAVIGKVSALVGPSGVGKSSLLNDIQPGLTLRTAEISDATGKGRHTTTTAELQPLTLGGWVADTPGLRELAIREVEPEDVAWLFPELREYAPHCRFSDCSHRDEMGCAVRSAVESGNIAAERYRSYLRVYEDVKSQKPFWE